jgi:DNA uptake protein ComE-like DNA-binding protein
VRNIGTFVNSVNHIKRMGRIVALTGILSVSLAACGGEAPSSVSPTATAPAAVETVTTAAPEVVETATTATTGGASETPTVDEASTPDAGTTTQVADCSKLNLNTLTEAQLMATIPSFPSRMVREFLEYRPYASIQQFRKEIGKYVDASQVTEWEKYVYVPVDPNNSDAETLMQIPGVDSSIADKLISARPYASNDAFLAALGAQISADQLAGAACYLDSNS